MVVTGATGYIASHIVRVLLEQGFKVRATVRDPSNTGRLKVSGDTQSVKEEFLRRMVYTRGAVVLRQSMIEAEAHEQHLHTIFCMPRGGRVHRPLQPNYLPHTTSSPSFFLLEKIFSS